MRMLRKLGLLVLLAAPSTAQAYIDPAPVILEKAAKARAALDLQSLFVEGAHVEGKLRHPLERGFAIGTGYFTEVRLGPDEVLVELVRDGRRWSHRVGEAAGAPAPHPQDLWLALVTHDARDPGGRRGLAFLSHHGIDASIVSLGRQQRRPVYIIGAPAGQLDVPQLWLDKELLVPVRLVMRSSEGTREIRLLGFHGPVTGPFFPEEIEERVGERLLRKTRIDRVEPNAPLEPRRLEAPR
ncbi:MAG: hypothetical protein AAGD10_06920 [Myxococcota bacterium]